MAEARPTTDFRPPSPAAGDHDGGSRHLPARPAEATSPAEPSSGDTDSGRTLVKVTVNLTPRAVEALDITCARTRDSKTDTINRALVVYQVVLDLMDRGGGQLMFQDREGHTERIHLL